MTRDQAISLARTIAESEGWLWRDPVHATLTRRYLILGPRIWHISTNTRCRGGNARISIHDLTGQILRKGFAPL